ncbi:regulatory protein GemA [Desulfoplanes formicivorans]|nr:regulatory protein GemA [Desulfoplanes formicivorans]
MLAKIHIAKKDLGLSDDAYRAILAEVGGAESAGDLDSYGLTRVVAHMRKLGFEPRRSKQNGALPADKASQIKRIWAQCYSLGRPVPEYADGLARKMWGVDRVVWCSHDQLQSMTAALAYQQRREGAETR